jgi:hypothetical protein
VFGQIRGTAKLLVGGFSTKVARNHHDDRPVRCGDTYAQLAAGFAPTLAEAMNIARTKAFVILDGALLPIDRIAADTPVLLGQAQTPRHERVQVLPDSPPASGREAPLWPAAVGLSRASLQHARHVAAFLSVPRRRRPCSPPRPRLVPTR